MPNYNYVGKRIRELRSSQYTKEAFAEKVDITPQLLEEIEMGKQHFSADLLCRISCELSVSCDYIMYGEMTSFEKNEKVMEWFEKLDTGQILLLRYLLEKFSELCDLL